jgi:hypothetical protein
VLKLSKEHMSGITLAMAQRWYRPLWIGHAQEVLQSAALVRAMAPAPGRRELIRLAYDLGYFRERGRLIRHDGLPHGRQGERPSVREARACRECHRPIYVRPSSHRARCYVHQGTPRSKPIEFDCPVCDRAEGSHELCAVIVSEQTRRTS